MFANKIFPFINLLTSSPYLVVTRRLDTDTTPELPSVPIPFAPPSDEFCATNTLGDDFYLSLWKPCKFIFFNNTCSSEFGHYTCGDTYDPGEVLSEAQLQVFMWPESCVSKAPRYYLMKDNPEMKNYIFSENSLDESNDIDSFPKGTVAFSVSCEADFATAQATFNEVEGNFSSVFHPFVGLVILFVLLGLCFCVGGVMCCCCCVPLCKKSRPRYRHRPESYPPGDKSEVEPLTPVVLV